MGNSSNIVEKEDVAKFLATMSDKEEPFSVDMLPPTFQMKRIPTNEEMVNFLNDQLSLPVFIQYMKHLIVENSVLERSNSKLKRRNDSLSRGKEKPKEKPPFQKCTTCECLRDENEHLQRRYEQVQKECRVFKKEVAQIRRLQMESYKFRQKRGKIVQEFYLSEKRYVGQLKLLKIYYIDPTNAKKFLATPQYENLAMLFKHFSLVYKINSEFLDELESILLESSKEDFLVDLILRFAKEFKHYADYTKYFNFAKADLRQLKKKNKKFENLVTDNQKVLKEKNERIFTMDGLMLVVIQRLPRYKLLLEDLQKNTQKRKANYRKLNKSVKFIGGIIEFVEKESRKHRNDSKITEINKNYNLQLSAQSKFIMEVKAKKIVESVKDSKEQEIDVNVCLLSGLVVVNLEDTPQKRRTRWNFQKEKRSGKAQVINLRAGSKVIILPQPKAIRVLIRNIEDRNNLNEVTLKFEDRSVFVGFLQKLQKAVEDNAGKKKIGEKLNEVKKLENKPSKKDDLKKKKPNYPKKSEKMKKKRPNFPKKSEKMKKKKEEKTDDLKKKKKISPEKPKVKPPKAKDLFNNKNNTKRRRFRTIRDMKRDKRKRMERRKNVKSLVSSLGPSRHLRVKTMV